MAGHQMEEAEADKGRMEERTTKETPPPHRGQVEKQTIKPQIIHDQRDILKYQRSEIQNGNSQIKKLININKCEYLAIFEPYIDSNKIEGYKKFLGFQHCVANDNGQI